MPNDGIRLKIILITEVRKLEFTDFDSHSLVNLQKCFILLKDILLKKQGIMQF